METDIRATDSVRSDAGARIVSVARISCATASSYILGYILTTILVLVGIAASLVNARGFIRRGLAFWGNLQFWLVGRRLHVLGGDNRRRGTPYLVLANHSSMYDIPALLAVAPDAALIGRDKLMRIPVFNMLLRAIHYIPIDTERVRKAHDAISEAVRKAGEGVSIGMFPEGTRTQTGDVQKLKRGFVSVLRGSGLDVLPVTIRGTFALKPKGRLTIDPRERIEAVVHPPIPNSVLAGLPDAEIMEKVRTTLEAGRGGEHGKQ
jgi:1-acyl-sn-glycerol-3-phosphate acyltransferase